MEVFSANELESIETNNHSPKLYVIILKFLVYFTVYILIPMCIFLVGTPVLGYFMRLIISVYEIRVLVGILIIYITYKLYKKASSVIFSKLQLNLRNEWIDYLILKEKKLDYYKIITSIVEPYNDLLSSILNMMNNFHLMLVRLANVTAILTVVLVYFLLCSLVWAHYQNIIFGLNIWKSKILLDHLESLNTDLLILIMFFFYSALLTTVALFVLGNFIIYVISSVIIFIFPMRNKILDASDIPISFIKHSINKLETFEFSDDFEQRQNKKIEIIQLINFASEHFIRVNKKETNNFMNISFTLLADQYSEAIQSDVLFRTNGLYKKIDEMCVEINNMNSFEEQSRIVQNLKMYLKIIENRDLSKIEPIEYIIKKPNLTSFFIKTVTFLNKIL